MSGAIATALLSRFNLYHACYFLLAVLTLGKSVARLQFAQDRLGITMNRSAAITRITIASLVIVISSSPKIPGPFRLRRTRSSLAMKATFQQQLNQGIDRN